MNALSILNPSLRFLQVFNAERLIGSRRVIFHRLIQALDVAVSWILFTTLIMRILWLSKTEGFQISSPTNSTFINTSQIVISFLLLVLSNRQISAAIEHLQSSIELGKSNL